MFWEQQALQLIQHRIQISRGSDAAQPAVKRHFDELVDRYDSVCNINLLSQREAAGESVLSKAYITAINQLDVPKNNVDMVHFDLHTECRGGNYDNLEILMRDIRMMLDTYGYFLMDTDENQMVCPQKGVFRTNCMDCLDRTNLVQNEISKGVLMEYLHNRFRDRMMMTSMETLVTKHSHLWAENGDSLSKIYAGTGALKSSFTRTGKVTFMNVLGDATRSVNRFYINNFQDKARQEVIDQLLGKLSNQVPVKIHDPISDSVAHQLSRRIREYSSSRAVAIFCGTYNLDGKSFRGELLDPWLLQHHECKNIRIAYIYIPLYKSIGNEQEPDIYALGIQEIVELSPQQVMSADEEKRYLQTWKFNIGIIDA